LPSAAALIVTLPSVPVVPVKAAVPTSKAVPPCTRIRAWGVPALLAEVERLRWQNEALTRENERGKLQAGDLVRAISSLRE
jgi:hypothetical protein